VNPDDVSNAVGRNRARGHAFGTSEGGRVLGWCRTASSERQEPDNTTKVWVNVAWGDLSGGL